jgi:hypothetical protein
LQRLEPLPRIFYLSYPRISAYFRLTLEAKRPPPPRVLQQELLMTAEERGIFLRGLESKAL